MWSYVDVNIPKTSQLQLEYPQKYSKVKKYSKQKTYEI